MDQIIKAWARVSVAMNSINRAMGRPDPYPFVLAPAVVKKLGFVHGLLRSDERTLLAARGEAWRVAPDEGRRGPPT